MSDYLGPNQTRVLDSTNRSFESITYQARKPPLSSEVNLGGRLSSDQMRDIVRNMHPSGCAIVGRIRDNISASSCQAGDVLCSPTFTRNTFKLIALNYGTESDKNIAWVNGYKVLIKGTSSTSDDNNIITLPEPPTVGTRVDFVFLEVWRKLVYPADVVYKYGNVLYGGTNFTNDLVDPALGIETSLRIQIQYRIRVAPCDIESYPDGFDPNQVFVQGPLPEPISTCSHSYFTQSEDDIGLWISGAGDSVAQETLETVDGHTYAIPLFAVRRRNTSDYDPDTRSNGAGRSLSDYNGGWASDRPDNLYNDWVVADDILDMRHRVIPAENLKEICEDGFKKLVANKNYSKMTKSSIGEDHYGVKLVEGDAVSNVDKAGTTLIAQGDGIRRIFSNAQMDQPDSLATRTTAQKTVGTPSTPWASSDQVQISLSGYPSGSQIVSVEEIYTSSIGVLSPSDYSLSSLPTGTMTITITGGSSVIGTSDTLVVDYTLRFPTGPNGLTYVPTLFLESRKEDSSASVAMQDMDIRVRDASSVGTTDGTYYNMLMNRGGNGTDLFDFGHQMTYHMRGNGTQIITFPRTINGYDIAGVTGIRVGGALRSNPTISRDATGYQIDVGSPAITLGRDVEVTLYTENKFFEGNKQGRAITDCFEMVEITPDETADGGRVQFHIDAGNRRILGIASYEAENGSCYAYVNGSRRVLETTNLEFPTDSTKGYGLIEFSVVDTPPSGATIEVPTLVNSAVGSTEGYSFFYETVPYQGLMDSSVNGYIEDVGPAVTTTAGSGWITDYTYSQGLAAFTDSSVVYGNNTEWLSNVKTGQYIYANADATSRYYIEEVYDNETLFLKVAADRSSAPVGESYTIIAKDQAFFNQTNIIDRMPTYESDNDASAKNGMINTAVSDYYPVLETRIISRVQDIAEMPANSFWVGQNIAERGRSTINLWDEEAPLGLGNLGLKFENLASSGNYKKTFQAYVFNHNNSGRLYLMVVGSETDNTSMKCFFNQSSNMDAVDIFELPGRPIVMRRIG